MEKCAIPHYYLHNDLSFPSCSPLHSRIRSHNKMCWGDWSPTSTTFAKVRGCPEKLTLSASQVQAESLTLKWQGQDGCSPIYNYKVEIKRPGDAFRDLLGTGTIFTATEYRVTSLECGENYEFRARAENKICPGRYSEHVFVRTSPC